MVIALAALEVGLRLRTPPPAGDLRGLHELRPDRPWLYGLRPGAEAELAVSGAVRYAVNADGFRDRRYAREKPPGTFRVVVLGDSIAFGYGVALEDSFPKRLETSLAALVPAAHPEVLDLGVSGYNPYTEAALFTDVGVRYAPDLVLVEFCANDLNDPTLHFDASTTARLLAMPDAAFPDPSTRTAPPPAPGPLPGPLTGSLTALCRRLRVCQLVVEAVAARPGTSAAELRAALLPRDDPSATELAWLRARYEEIARAAAAHGGRFALVVFPYRTQVEGDAPARLQQHLARLGSEAGWVVVDLLPAFRRAAREARAPLFYDLWHPTAAGHRVAADAILEELRARGLLPIRPSS